MNATHRQQLLAVVAAIAVGLLLLDWLVVTPLTRAWKTRSERIVQLRNSVQQGRLLLQRESALRARWQSMLTNMLAAEASTAESQVLRAFERWAAASQVTVTSVRPQWKPLANQLLTLECRVEAAGSLATLSRFLYELERDPLAIKVDTLELSARDDTGSQLTLGLQVSGLVSNALTRVSRR
jgi:hypothetical protein